MRVRAHIAALAGAAACAPAAAAHGAAPSADALAADATALVSGVVTRAESRWSGSSIVTESTIQLEGSADGAELDVVQLGGTVKGIGMWVSHSPPVLETGQYVHAQVRAARTASGDARWTLADAVPVVAAPELGAGDEEDLGTLPFVRTITDNHVPVEWASGCVFITYHEDGTSHLAGDSEFSLMDGIFGRWESDADDCSYLRFVHDGRDDNEVGFDGVNMVIFREDRWCRPPSGDDPEICYSPSAAGITTLFFVNETGNRHDGEILDADIELNAVDFAISSGGESRGDASCQADLANTLTHEVGHLIGLDHTCWSGEDPHPRDHEGNLAPDCSRPNLPPEITEATMYAFQQCGETHKASLTADDIAGKCAIYASARDPGTCERVSIGGCCSLAAAGYHAEAARGGAAAAILGALVLFALRARSRRPHRPAAPRSS